MNKVTNNANPKVELLKFLNDLFITDGGIETTFIYLYNIPLPYFSASLLMADESNFPLIRTYYKSYLSVAKSLQCNVVLGTVGWRGSAVWGERMGMSSSQMEAMNISSVQLLREVIAEETSDLENNQYVVILSGNIGPAADGYRTDFKMSTHEAKARHTEQIQWYKDSGTDIVSAFTINYVEEAIGIVWAAHDATIPVVISFTIETDGLLPSGQMLKAAITEVDLVTNHTPLYYMVNCAHPDHIVPALLEEDAPWRYRVCGIRGNASRKNHEELDKMTTLDAGDPEEFGFCMKKVVECCPWINIVGGCCGTDERHIEAACRLCKPLKKQRTVTC